MPGKSEIKYYENLYGKEVSAILDDVSGKKTLLFADETKLVVEQGTGGSEE